MLNVFEMCATLGLDSSSFESGLGSAENSTSGLGAKAVAVGNVMADAFEAVISKVAEYGQKVVEVGEEQETALAKVNTIMDTSKMSTDEMADSIKDLSSEMGVSVTELSDTVYNAISATGDTANAVALAGQASKLATAGFTDTSSALSVLTTAMNAYGLSADQAEDISDSLIQVQNLGVTTVSELASSMGKAIASASAYGVDLGNLESAYVSITKAGINTAEGTTYISSMLKELGDSGSDVSEILQEETGKSFDQLMSEGKTLGDVLGILNDSVDGDSTALMNLWSSAEAGKASSAIVGQGLENFNSNLKQIETTSGATETAFDTMADTLEHKVSIFQTTGENLMSSMYEGMSGKLGDIVSFGTEVLENLQSGFDEGGLAGFAVALGESIFDALDLAFQTIGDNAETIMNAITEFMGSIAENSDFASSALTMLTSLFTAFVDNLPTMITYIAEFVASFAQQLASMLPTLIPTVIELILTIAEGLIDNIDLLIDAAIALITGLADGLINSLPVLLEKAPEIIEKLVNAIIDNVPKLIEAALKIMVSLAKGIITNLPKIIESGDKIISTLINTIGNYASKLMSVGKDVVSYVGDGIKNIASEAATWGKDMMESFINGIKEKIQAVKETVSGVAQTVKNLLGFSEPDEGPLSNFHTYAPDMMKLFAQGIADNEGIVRDQIADSFDFGTIGNISTETTAASKSADNSNQQNNITITLEGDAAKLFKVMRQENSKYMKSTGVSAFA